MASNVPSRRLALLGRSGEVLRSPVLQPGDVDQWIRVVPVLQREADESAGWIVRGAAEASPLARVVGVIAPSRR